MKHWLELIGLRRRSAKVLLTCIVIAAPALNAELSKQSCADLDPRNGLRVATGPAGGAYEKLGISLKEQTDLAKYAGIHLQLCNTGGSIDNTALLAQGAADVGFVQSDNMLDHWLHAMHADPRARGDAGGQTPAAKAIFLVSRLYSERLHLAVGPDSGIYSITNLKGKHIWLGSKGSGSRHLAFEVLRAAGFEDSDIYAMDYCPGCSIQKALADLSSGKVSALFRATSIPQQNRAGNNASQEECDATLEPGTLAYTMCAYPEVRLFGFDETVLHNLTQNPRYCQTLIPRNVYPNQNYAVSTIGVQAMLVTTMESRDPRVEALYTLLKDRRREIEKNVGSRFDLFESKLDSIAAGELSSHVHDQVKKQILPSTTFTLFWRVSVIVAIIVLLGCLLRPGASPQRYEARVRLGVCLILLILVWVALAYSLYKTEGRFSVEYRSPWDASWSVLMHYAHGLQTPTMTSTGREIAFFGLGVFLLLAGWLRSAIIDGLLDRAAKGLGNICGHAEVWVTAVLAVGMNFASEFVPQPNRLFHNSTFWTGRPKTRRNIGSIQGPSCVSRPPGH